MHRLFAGASALALAAAAVPADAQDAPVDDGAIIVTAAKRAQNVQDVPIAVSVLGGAFLEQAGAHTIGQIAQLQPTLQFISSNPRNTATTIRGLGSNYGLTNDGLEQGVGVYVDEVYNARPAAATFDLLDVERIEVLRGPQGTLFGKNTTAGAISVVTRAPSFTPDGRVEVSVGDYGYLQGKATFSGPVLGDVVAARISLGATERDGVLYNVTTGEDQNDVSNRALRAQVLVRPNDDVDLRLSADIAEAIQNCCTQVFVRHGARPSSVPASAQYPALAAAFGYAPPSLDPFDRLADVDSPIQANQDIGGVSAQLDWNLGGASLKAISAYRFWDWKPLNDRDYTALPIRIASANPSQQHQWSHELRLASEGENRVDWVLGLYAFGQEIETSGHEAWGAAAARWLIGTSVPANLLDGYAARTNVLSTTDSYAAFGEATWNVTDRLRLTGGLRYTVEEKTGRYEQSVSGGLQTTDPALVARKNAIARAQFYEARVEDDSLGWRASIAYDLSDDVLAYVTATHGAKSGGVNAAGIPTDAAGNPALVSAVVRPEQVDSYELGLKAQLFDRALTINLAAYATEVSDYQANVVDTGPGALRGYLANIESVEVKGVEVEMSFSPHEHFTSYASIAWTDGAYASFANGPCPLELLGPSTSACDLSGRRLPGVSEWAASAGAEWSREATFGALAGEIYLGADVAYRSDWYSDASASVYSRIGPSTLVNLRLGYRVEEGWDASLWAKNAFDEDYLAFTSVQAGNSGLIVGQPGDPRTIGLTLRRRF